MVSLSAIYLGLAVALTGFQAHAAPIDAASYMALDDVSILDHSHPAFGAALDPAASITVVSSDDDIGAGASNRTDGESGILPMEVNPNPDTQRLQSYFGTPMETNVNKLVKAAQVSPLPWPSSYWPVYLDGINARWNGNDASPAEKYARAFGLDPKKFTDTISRNNGILSQSWRRACGSNADCDGLNDGSECGIRSGESRGYCIPTWFGICHAWAPAAMLEAEPKCAVNKNGVTFRPFDIKALITQIYDGASAGVVFTGVRYNGPVNGPKDQYGRFTDAAYRDLNAGYFHVAFSNILGRFKRSFILDVSAGPEVWNQPIRGYNVVEQKTYTPVDAARQFYRANAYPFNANAVSIQYVRTRFSWIVEAYEDGPLVSTGRVNQYTNTVDYTYLLELDASGNIIGGEWLGRSNGEHPDFLWFVTAQPSVDTVTNVGLSYKNVRALLDASVRGNG
ncbi:TPA: hypothetical protein N0F65_002364 [Lagenidium giganteum]|uniref:Uncharacterized protein n=1 Tax=Lagenidium giganteum TaxID=4803 RepID=A0AAV2YKX6_9STRA|nr:TPA: hypothetical protein N0F65_002364 [Lagenidium giganteum]